MPYPLPGAVRSAAIGLFSLFSTIVVIGAIFVVCSGIAVVVMPLVMGRAGVGTAMITLFLFSVVAVLSGVSLLSARSAARVLRRERESVRPLSVLSVCAALLCAAAAGITWWLAAAFLEDSNGTQRSYDGTTLLVMAVPVTAFLFFAFCAVVLRGYGRELASGK